MKYLLKLEDKGGRERLYFWDTDRMIAPATPRVTLIEKLNLYQNRMTTPVMVAIEIFALVLFLVAVMIR